MTQMNKEINLYFQQVQETITHLNVDEINCAMNAIMDAYNKEVTIYIFGNGGSAATASHFVCEIGRAHV